MTPTTKGAPRGKNRTFAITVGPWGGFYLHRGKGTFAKRLCLGFIAFTYVPADFPEMLGVGKRAEATRQ